MTPGQATRFKWTHQLKLPTYSRNYLHIVEHSIIMNVELWIEHEVVNITELVIFLQK